MIRAPVLVPPTLSACPNDGSDCVPWILLEAGGRAMAVPKPGVALAARVLRT